jgi:hypothetical protein
MPGSSSLELPGVRTSSISRGELRARATPQLQGLPPARACSSPCWARGRGEQAGHETVVSHNNSLSRTAHSAVVDVSWHIRAAARIVNRALVQSSWVPTRSRSWRIGRAGDSCFNPCLAPANKATGRNLLTRAATPHRARCKRRPRRPLAVPASRPSAIGATPRCSHLGPRS